MDGHPSIGDPCNGQSNDFSMAENGGMIMVLFFSQEVQGGHKATQLLTMVNHFTYCRRRINK